MDAQLVNIVNYLSHLSVTVDASELKAVVKNIYDDRHVRKAIAAEAPDSEMLPLIGRRILQRLGIAETLKVYRDTAQLGLMVENAINDGIYLERNPGSEDFGYTRSNRTFGNQCGHQSDHPIICSICGKYTKPFGGQSVSEMFSADEY